MTSPRLTILLMAIGLVLAPLPAGAEDSPSPSSGMEKPSYRVGAGDLLRVVVWKNPELSGDCLVRPDGIITLPLVGDIIAGGMATDSIGLQIERKLKYFIESPMVTVIVAQAGSSQVFILGQVARPGAYPLPGPLNLLQALAGAGGFTPYADRNALTVIRQEGNQQVRMRFRFDDLVAGREKNGPLLLLRGDTLIVP